MHRAVCTIDHFPRHARRLPCRKSDFPNGERISHARFQLIRSDPVAVCTVSHQRVRLTVTDEIYAADFDVRDGLVHILRDGVADGRVAGQVERFAEVGSNMTRCDDTGLNFACVNGFCCDLFRGNGSRSNVVGCLLYTSDAADD